MKSLVILSLVSSAFIQAEMTVEESEKLGQLKLEKLFFPTSCSSECLDDMQPVEFVVKSGNECPKNPFQDDDSTLLLSVWDICLDEVKS